MYFGDGKGKTTASIGLTVRAVGRGRKVVFTQFLKECNTGEIASLKRLGVRVIRSENYNGFYYKMNEDQQKKYRTGQLSLLEEAREAACGADPADLLVLDEVVDICDLKMVDENILRDFILQKPTGMEIVLTGHCAPDWLVEMADYVTEMKKHKHPYDRGIVARESIEY
ncbi:MAG: cob(I)yrinic acid a,c-diamide adenosyltransferase [Clostridiales bacterium]|nr:cob(I)yrinic acid a,c-diamide adenosyltransferase [Clostridiales bacterium]